MKDLIVINGPVAHLVFEGNIRDKVAKSKFVAFADYCNGVTTCFIKIVGKYDRAMERSIKKDFSRYGKIKSIAYRPSGVEITRINPN